jgi:UDP-glucose 4-epimerase
MRALSHAIRLKKTKNQVETYNIGSEGRTTVKTIAETVTKETKLKNVKFRFTGGVNGGRGWKGDFKKHRSIDRSNQTQKPHDGKANTTANKQ